MSPSSQPRFRRRGATIIEFALVAVLLCLIMFAGIELDRMVFVYTNLADAAKAGVRYAITHGGDRSGSGVNGASGPGNNPTQVVTAVTQYVTAVDTTRLTVNVTYPNSSNAAGNPVKVVVSYSYDPWTGLPFGVTLNATSQGIITF